MIDIRIKNLGNIMQGNSTVVERHDQFDVNNNFLNEKNTFLLHCLACGILVPSPGIESSAPALGAWSLNHWEHQGSSRIIFLIQIFKHLKMNSYNCKIIQTQT